MKHHFPDSVLSRITGTLEGRYAFHVTKTRWGELEKAILEAAAASGRTPEQIAQLAAEAACPADILDILVRHVTVGETYFFRHPEQFTAVETSILPELIAGRRMAGAKRLTVWSAGCSTGEEAYSLAIMLVKAIPDHKDWDISIVATDINTKSLETARAGAYREWSFRGLDDAFKSTWFDAVVPDDARGEYSRFYRVKPEIRAMVKFSSLNLAQGNWSASELPSAGFDLVFCRNVLMYFPRAVALDILRHIRGRMIEGACLAVAPSEASMAHASGFRTLRFSDCSLFRKTAPQPKATRATTIAVTVTAAAPPARHSPYAAKAAKPADRASPIPPPQPVTTTPRVHSLAEQAHAAANAGNLQLAEELVKSALAATPTDYAAHYLYAVMSMEKGELNEAYSALTSTLFLHPDFVPALIAIGNVTRQQGRHEEAARHFRNAVHVLEKMDPGTIIPESEGIQAGSLLQMAKALRDVEKQS